jgi:hypothetical protein
MQFDPNYDDWYDFFGSEEETTGATFTDDTPTDTPMYEDYYGGE